MLQVTLVTKTECEFCERAKEILHHLGNELAISVHVIEYDSPEGRRLARENGVLFAPGIFIDGRLASYGRPSERRLRRELQAAAKRALPQLDDRVTDPTDTILDSREHC